MSHKKPKAVSFTGHPLPGSLPLMLQPVVKVLGETLKTDVFCTKLTAPYQKLGLSVEPLGPIEFPITARTAKSLIVEAEPAKYGRGTQTLLDREVRDVWEIPRNQIQIDQTWDQELDSILKQVQKNLDLPEDGKLQAELHNLLIYMPGQFFKGHQDTEKTDGMIGTLVVLLPSEFSGGTLIIDQHGDKKLFHAPSDISKKLTLIGFYVDCHHEVQKVTAGYRVALTYNLIFKASSNRLTPMTHRKLEKAVKAYFDATEIQCSTQAKHPRWLIYLLDHEYSQTNLSWTGLRGADRSRAAQFLSCADSLGLEVHLALADIHETWDAQESESWGGYDDEDDEDEQGKDQYEVIDLIDDDIELRHWIDREG